MCEIKSMAGSISPVLIFLYKYAKQRSVGDIKYGQLLQKYKIVCFDFHMFCRSGMYGEHFHTQKVEHRRLSFAMLISYIREKDEEICYAIKVHNQHRVYNSKRGAACQQNIRYAGNLVSIHCLAS